MNAAEMTVAMLAARAAIIAMVGEKRTIYNGRTAHLDCAVDFEHDRDKEQPYG